MSVAYFAFLVIFVHDGNLNSSKRTFDYLNLIELNELRRKSGDMIMGGPLRKGYVRISGVILESVKEEIKSMVAKGQFRSVSQAVGLLLEEAAEIRKNPGDFRNEGGVR